MLKYAMLRERLLKEGVMKDCQLEAAVVAEAHLAKLAHDHDYVDQVIDLSLDPKKARRIGLPLTRDMVNRTLASLDASFKAATWAVEHGLSASLAGGTHHAGVAHGEGYCFFNDFAVISRKYSDLNILIIDLDVHQGNGNGAILKDDLHVDIIDLYCEQNYPFRKSLDGLAVSLNEGMRDHEYLTILDETLALARDDYDLILYQAGVDIFEGDDLGLLNISQTGIMKRDERVFRFAKAMGASLSFAIGGGYCKDISQTVECNFNTFVVAKEVFGDSWDA